MPSPLKCAWCQRADAKSLTVHIIAGVRHLLCSDGPDSCHRIRLANNPAGVYLRVGEAERREKPKADETLRLPDNWPVMCPKCGAMARCGQTECVFYGDQCSEEGHGAQCTNCGHTWQPGEADGEHDHIPSFSSGAWQTRELVAEEPLAPDDSGQVVFRGDDPAIVYGNRPAVATPSHVVLPWLHDAGIDVLPVPWVARGADETRLAWAKDFSLKVWLIRKGNTLTADVAHQDDRWRGRDAGGVTRTLAGETRQYQVASDWGPAIYESVTGDTDLYLRGLDRDCDGWSSSYMYPSPELAQEALEAFTEIIMAAKLPEGVA